MFVIDYYLSNFQENLLLEFGANPGGAGFPPGGRFAPPGGGVQPQIPPPDGPPTGLVEFEDIKKYVLFGKLKEIKLKLELSNINKNDPQVLNLFEFLDIIMLFYNTFTYDQVKKHIDILLEMFSNVIKIKIPKREDVMPALDQSKVQQVHQQAQQEVQDQQAQQAQQDQQQVQDQQNDQEQDVQATLKQKDKEISHHKKEAQLAKKETQLTKKGAVLAKSSLQRKKVAEV